MSLGEEDQTLWWQGMAREWDEIPKIRDRIRRGDHLLLPDPDHVGKVDDKDPMKATYIEKSMANLRYNSDVVLVALKRWFNGDPSCVPQVDCLSSEIEKLLDICYREHPGATYIHKDAWALRRLMTLLKSLTTKPNPPKDACLQLRVSKIHVSVYDSVWAIGMHGLPK